MLITSMRSAFMSSANSRMSSAFSAAVAFFLLFVEANFLDVLPDSGFEPVLHRGVPHHVLPDLRRRNWHQRHGDHVDDERIVPRQEPYDVLDLGPFSGHDRQ